MRVIILYADVLFFVNLSMDFLTIYITSKLTHGKTTFLRLMISSVIGAVYGVAAVVFIKNQFLSAVGTWGISVAMTFISFGIPPKIINVISQSTIMWGCGALLSGIMSGIISMGNPVFTEEGAAATYSVCYILTFASAVLFIRIISRKKDCKSSEIQVEINGDIIGFSALVDSGSLVREPLSGYPVVITSSYVLGEALTKQVMAFSRVNSENTDKTSSEMTVKLRIIPHTTLNGSGIMYGFIPDRITVNGKTKNAVIAMDIKGKQNQYGGFNGIVPMCLCE